MNGNCKLHAASVHSNIFDIPGEQKSSIGEDHVCGELSKTGSRRLLRSILVACQETQLPGTEKILGRKVKPGFKFAFVCERNLIFGLAALS